MNDLPPADLRVPRLLGTRQGGPDLAQLETQLGNLVIEEELARTPRAMIFRIQCRARPEQPLALKVALAPVEAEDLVRFQHEVRLLSEVRHPNVVEVYDFGVLPGRYPFLAMELLELDDPYEVVKSGDWERFYDLALKAAAGLAHIHRHGILHLDIKPQNLALGRPSSGILTLKLLDFGLAQNVRGPMDRRIRGTLAYAAPEILLQDRYDHRADLYSLGMTLFQMATGVLPSAGDDMAAIRYHLQGASPDPLAYRPDMPVPLASILRQLLERDPTHRFHSAGQLLFELANAVGRKLDVGAMALGEGAVLASRMVGRQEALDELLLHLERTANGEGSAVLLEGQQGVGKSRLLREFRLRAAMHGARLGVARVGLQHSEGTRPLRDALGQLGLTLESLDNVESTLQDLGAELARLARQQGPLVLLLDELPAANSATDWVPAVAAEIAEAPVLLIAARRSEPGGTRAVVESTPGMTTVLLQPLAAEQVADLVDACLGSRGLPSALYDWVYQHAGGLPGRSQQLLRHLVEERILQFRQGEWKPSLSALSRLASRPGGLESLDRERLDALPVAERQILEAAALIGEPFRWPRLAELLEVDPQEVFPSLSLLVERGMLERLIESDGELYQPPAAHLLPLVYDAIDPERRRALHRRLAELLRRDLEDGEDSLHAAMADHLWRAGERVASLPHLLAAATAARGRYAHGEAAELLGRAADVTHEQGDSRQEQEIRLQQADSLDAVGATGRALRLYRASLEVEIGKGRRTEDRRRRASLWLKVASLHCRLGESAASLEACQVGLEELGEVEDAELEIDLQQARSDALIADGQSVIAFRTAREALRRATRLGLTAQRAGLLGILGRIFCRRRDWRRGRRLLARGCRAAEVCGSPRLVVSLRSQLANAWAGSGDFARATQLHEENLRQAEARNDLWSLLETLHCLALLKCRTGNWKEARGPLVRSLELRRRLGARDGEGSGWLALGEVEEMLGDWPRARRYVARALKIATAEGRQEEVVQARAQLASLARKRGDWIAAEELAQRALTDAERLGRRELLVLSHHELGRAEKARKRWVAAAAHLHRARELAEEAGLTDWLPRLHNSLADLEIRRGEPSEAEAHAVAAQGFAGSLGDRFELAKAASTQARVAVQRNEHRVADQLFGNAVRALEELEVPFEYAIALCEWGVRTVSADIAVERLDRALVAFDRLGAATELERTRGLIEGIRERQHLQGGRSGQPGLWEVAKVLNSSLDLKEVLDRSMDLALERLRAERGMIVLLHQLTGELEVATARNLSQDAEGEGRALSETVVRRVIEGRQPILAIDAMTDSRFSGAESIVASHILSILCVPLAIRDRVAGAIYLDHCQSQHLFSETDVDFLVAFGDQAALAIDNARLYGELDGARQRLKAENESLRREILSSRHLGSLIGRSRVIVQLKETIERVAQNPSTVLMRGESGTGKGLAARILHSISGRREGPFIHFNCAALPETLVESELFGHERGAFTGATSQKPGRFELAHKGTIFLDEIGKVSRSVQSKLLRVVEDKEFERVGGTRTLTSDVRIVAATNLNLEEAIAKGDFREDLYYRLNIIPIVLPPLRERREDIPYLVDHFIKKISRDLGQPPKRLGQDVLDLFHEHRWPGNVRELEATVHRALVLARGDELTAADFSWLGAGASIATRPQPRQVPSLANGRYAELLDGFDKQLLVEALEQCGGRIRESARMLGIARNTLKAKLKRYGLAGAAADPGD